YRLRSLRPDDRAFRYHRALRGYGRFCPGAHGAVRRRGPGGDHGRVHSARVFRCDGARDRLSLPANPALPRPDHRPGPRTCRHPLRARRAAAGKRRHQLAPPPLAPHAMAAAPSPQLPPAPEAVPAPGTALVTGGSTGIGLELARLLAADGWTVVLVARDPSRLAAAAAGLRDTYSASVLP